MKCSKYLMLATLLASLSFSSCDTSNDGQYYPTMSTYTFGLTLKF